MTEKANRETGMNRSILCRPVYESGREDGQQEPYEVRASRTVLWEAGGRFPRPTRPGGVISSVYSTAL